jgi:hypothetical protein
VVDDVQTGTEATVAMYVHPVLPVLWFHGLGAHQDKLEPENRPEAHEGADYDHAVGQDPSRAGHCAPGRSRVADLHTGRSDG